MVGRKSFIELCREPIPADLALAAARAVGAAHLGAFTPSERRYIAGAHFEAGRYSIAGVWHDARRVRAREFTSRRVVALALDLPLPKIASAVITDEVRLARQDNTRCRCGRRFGRGFGFGRAATDDGSGRSQ